MIRAIACLVTVGLILSAITAFSSESNKEAAALCAAKKWLAALDNEKYAESWKEASELFRNTVQRQLWSQSLKAVREPMGKLISRLEFTLCR